MKLETRSPETSTSIQGPRSVGESEPRISITRLVDPCKRTFQKTFFQDTSGPRPRRYRRRTRQKHRQRWLPPGSTCTSAPGSIPATVTPSRPRYATPQGPPSHYRSSTTTERTGRSPIPTPLPMTTESMSNGSLHTSSLHDSPRISRVVTKG